MSLMGLAEQTYVSCSRMWIPMAKTAESRILGEEKQKDDRIESDSISPPVPIAIASWGCVSGPCILQLSSGISYSPVLYSESRTQPFTSNSWDSLRSQSAMDTVLIEPQMLQVKDRAYIN